MVKSPEKRTALKEAFVRLRRKGYVCQMSSNQADYHRWLSDRITPDKDNILNQDKYLFLRYEYQGYSRAIDHLDIFSDLCWKGNPDEIANVLIAVGLEFRSIPKHGSKVPFLIHMDTLAKERKEQKKWLLMNTFPENTNV